MFLYNIGIYLYAFAVWLVSPFNSKAKKMLEGHKEVFTKLKENIDPNSEYIWIHAASLGEFEQGRPIMEAIRKEYPQYKILLSFFSPSGYEVRKSYELADLVCYLPFDKKRKVKKFLKLSKPKKAIFIKYEYWYNYVNELRKMNIPSYMVSAIFRPSQFFFKWYGTPMRKILEIYNCICLQDEKSKQLLARIGIHNVKICGDTRFDRVLDIQTLVQPIDTIHKFAAKAKAEGEKILVAGSSWPKDEDIFIQYFNETSDLKLVVAPHEIDEAHLKYIEDILARPHIRLSQASPGIMDQYDCIIIDSFGLLASIYRYADVCYVGGGFGAGIHNILEAAVYYSPVIFGPNFKKFREAHDLVELGGGYAVSDYTAYRSLMDEFMQYNETLEASGKHAGQYVKENAGAVNTVMNVLFKEETSPKTS